MTDREYNTVIRATANRPIHNYTLILNTEPLHVRQYCRTLTLAQGRILYELWEDDARLDRDPRVLGQFVPSHLAEEARNLSSLPRSEEWKGKPSIVIRRYEEAWECVVNAWPGIPVFGARRVVERLIRLRVSVGRQNVKEAVARYALRCWSAYKTRLEAKGKEGVDDGSIAFRKVEEGVRREVEGRVMEVLRGWMGQGVRDGKADELSERLGLKRVEEKRYRGVWFD
ncbi:hypothetical protein Q7P36_005135 [Cladosporium allicinum]